MKARKVFVIALCVVVCVGFLSAIVIPLIGFTSARAFQVANSANLRQVGAMLRNHHERGQAIPASVFELSEYAAHRDHLAFMVSEEDDSLLADWMIVVSEWPEDGASDTVVAIAPAFSVSDSGRRWRFVLHWEGYVEAMHEEDFWGWVARTRADSVDAPTENAPTLETRDP